MGNNKKNGKSKKAPNLASRLAALQQSGEDDSMVKKEATVEKIVNKLIVKRSNNPTDVDGKQRSVEVKKKEQLAPTLSTFVVVHMVSYLVSSLGLVAYGYMYMMGDKKRVEYISFLEFGLLVVRWFNETLNNRDTVLDHVHHCLTLTGMYILASDPRFEQFEHMQILLNTLHVPMVLWHAGCRSNSFFECLKMERYKEICVLFFPYLYMAASHFRMGIFTVEIYFVVLPILESFSMELLQQEFLRIFVLTFFGLLFAYLDFEWATSMFGKVNYPQKHNKFFQLGSFHGVVEYAMKTVGAMGAWFVIKKAL